MTDDHKKVLDKEKRSQERWWRVEQGVAEMQIWLQDLIKAGLLTLPEKDAAFFERIRARMVDAQATGLANLVRELQVLDYSQPERWQNTALQLVSKLFLLVQGFRNFDKLDELKQQDLKYQIGWSVSQKEILQQQENEVITDEWLCVASISELVDDITVQRNWLYGLQCQKMALVIYFAYRNMPIDSKVLPFQAQEITLVYVPSAFPQRAIIQECATIPAAYQQECIVPLQDWEMMQNRYAEFLSVFPYLEEYPFVVQQLSPAMDNTQRKCLIDQNNHYLYISDSFDEIKWYQLLAISGAKPLTMFVLYKNQQVIPLGVVGKKKYVNL